jgi:RNA polymerase sigma factor (sigma-70 family)
LKDQSWTDEDILKAHNTGDVESAFKMILAVYKQRLYWHVRKIVVNHDDADDAVQSAFIKIWKNLSGFKRQSKLSTWMYRIATNEALQLLRSKRPNISIDEDLSKDVVDLNGVDLDGDEIEEKLQLALLNVPNKQRLVFNMKYFQELKYEEISDILGTSVGALKASYHLAVKKIEKYLNEN